MAVLLPFGFRCGTVVAVETSSYITGLSALLDDREVILGAVDALSYDRRSEPALQFLIRFDDLNKALAGVELPSVERETMRRALTRLVSAMTRPDAFREVDIEIAVVRGLAGSRPTMVAPRRARRFPGVVALIALAVGAAGVLTALSYRSNLDETREEVSELKERLGEVANEKAQEQDEKEAANAIAAELTQIAEFAAMISYDLESCIDYTALIAQAALDLGNGVSLSSSYVDTLIADTTETCRTARSNAADLRGYVDSLR